MIRLLLVPLFLFCLLLSTRALYGQQDAAGRWKGTIEIPGQSLGIEVELKNGTSWSGTYDIPAQKVKGFPLEKLAVNPPDISFVLGGGIPGAATFTLRLSADGKQMEGTFAQSGMTFPTTLKKETSDAATNTPPAMSAAEMRTFIDDMRKKWGIPGMGVAIVKGGDVFLAEGFGERDVEKHLPVTPSTQFAIGSTTKAFTSVIIGTLVDEGKLEWETPVITYLPDFRLHDEYATTHLTVHDLLTHVSGLPRHDLLWYGADFTQRELYDRLRFLEPTAPLRQKWQYQNLMYMTAGLLAEKVSGKSWEQLVRERIFAPLGMKNATLSIADMQAVADFSQPYAKKDGKITAIDFRSLESIAPAGAINAGADEMAAWLQLNLNGGQFGGTQVISETSLHDVHSPSVVIAGETGVPELLFNMYAMGWMVSAYRGHRLLHHGGGIDGFVSHVALLPDDGIGIVVLTNRPTGLPEIAMLDIADRMLELEPLHHATGMLGGEETPEKEEDEEEQNDVARVKGTKPTYPMGEYEGIYEHPAYGPVRVLRNSDVLSAVFHGDTAKLEHYHYDVFSPGEAKMVGMLIAFQPDARGGVASLTMGLEPSSAPILFKKMPPEQLRDPSYLKRFAGTYTLSGQEVKVEIRDSILTVVLPGQPSYKLLPGKEKPGAFAEFSINGLDGYHVRFDEEKGRVKRLTFLQPNGTFTGEKIE